MRSPFSSVAGREEPYERRWDRDWSRRWASCGVYESLVRGARPSSDHDFLASCMCEDSNVSGLGRRPERVRLRHVERLMQTLSVRDWQIVESVYLLRVVSGSQLQRLHFSDHGSRSQSVMRWRVLKRLVDARVLVPLERRVGTARRGSAASSYALDSAGLRLMRLKAYADAPELPVRRPRLPGERFIAHMLAVSEVYVNLVERSRRERWVLDGFQAEPESWVKNGLGGWLKPDAYVKLRAGAITDFWWLEVDLATESLPTVRRQLLAYLDFVARGQLGPDGIYPRVLIGVPTEARLRALRMVCMQLPEPASVMFRVSELADMAAVLSQEIMQW